MTRAFSMVALFRDAAAAAAALWLTLAGPLKTSALAHDYAPQPRARAAGMDAFLRLSAAGSPEALRALSLAMASPFPPTTISYRYARPHFMAMIRVSVRPAGAPAIVTPQPANDFGVLTLIERARVAISDRFRTFSVAAWQASKAA